MIAAVGLSYICSEDISAGGNNKSDSKTSVPVMNKRSEMIHAHLY